MLITGTAGFIGFHLVQKLLNRDDQVAGIDNINDCCDINLKYDRLAETGFSYAAEQWPQPLSSQLFPGYTYIRMDLEDCDQHARQSIHSFSNSANNKKSPLNFLQQGEHGSSIRTGRFVERYEKHFVLNQ